MNTREKSLYHQIHPLKLATDWSTGLIALYLLWQHDLLPALVVAFVPSVIVSLVLMQWVNLGAYKQSSFGAYISRYMTRLMETIRVAGYVVMAIGAWYHMAWLIPLGLLVVLLAWFRGVLFPVKP